MLQFQRDDLLKKYKKASFPMGLIAKECLPHSDIIFNQESTDVQLQINQTNRSKDIFFLDTEEKKPKTQKEVPTENFTMGWRTQKTDTNNVKPKDNKQLKTQQKPKSKETKSIENKSDSQLNNETINELPKPKPDETPFDNSNKNVNSFNEAKTNPINQIPPTLAFNQNPMLNYMQQQNVIFQQLIQPNLMMQNDPYFDPNFDIKVLEKYNQKLQFPENLPLWYLFHPMIKSSFGPLTTHQVENMFISKQIFSNSLIRFIDIYELKDHDQFNFFPIKDLENQNLLNEVIPSKVLKYLYVDNVNNIIPKANHQENPSNIVQNNNINNELIENDYKQEEIWDDSLQPIQNDSNSNNKIKKNNKKKKQKINNEENSNVPKNNNNYNPSIATFNTNPNSTTFVNNTDDGHNWEEVKKAKKTEKRSGKVVGANSSRTSNNPMTYLTSNTNQNINQNLASKKVPDTKPQTIDGSKLVEELISKKKLDPSIEIIETDYISQPNNKSLGGGKKGKKGVKTKFTDLNIEIGVENVGGDVYKVESKKKK